MNKTDYLQIAHRIAIIVSSDWAIEVDEEKLAAALELDQVTYNNWPIPTEDGFSDEDKVQFPNTIDAVVEK
jgi:hypothetical protein